MTWTEGGGWTIMDSMDSSDSYCFLTCYYLCLKMIGKLCSIETTNTKQLALGKEEERE